MNRDETSTDGAQSPARTLSPTSTRTDGSRIRDDEERAAGDPKRPIKRGANRRKPAKSAAIVPDNSDDDFEDGTDSEPVQAEEAKKAKKSTLKLRKRRQKATTTSTKSPQPQDPTGQESDQSGSDPEAHQIDPTTLSMFELSFDARHGRVSEREKKMATIDWDEVAQKRRKEIERTIAGKPAEQAEGQTAQTTNAVESTEGAAATAGAEPEPEHAQGSEEPAGRSGEHPEQQSQEQLAAEGAFGTSGGPTFVTINGQITVVESSVVIDRQAEAETQMEDGAPPEEENDLTLRHNRATWINARRREPTERVPMWRSRSDPWSEDETDRFYDALKMFGTDFFIISKMFVPKTRKQMKLKFVREERLDPVRINNALLGKDTKPMDLDHYAQETGRDVSVFTKYESFEHANEIIRESMKEKEDEMREAEKVRAEDRRQAGIQQQQREKQKELAEKRKAERKAGRRRGKMGAGTMGGGPDETT